MTRRTAWCFDQERPRLVTLRTLERLVQTIERKTGLCHVVELFGCKRTDIAIDTSVFHVAGHAVVGHVAMHAAPRRDPLRNRFVAGQASFSGDLAPRLVTGGALRQTFQLGVGFGERSGRDQGTKLGIRH